VKIIWDSQWLTELEKKIFAHKKIVLDTETTALNPREALLVGISILVDEDNIFYINFRHTGPQINYESWKKFVSKLLESDIEIIGHNLKYDLQILETFLQNDQTAESKNTVSDFWQISLEV